MDRAPPEAETARQDRAGLGYDRAGTDNEFPGPHLQPALESTLAPHLRAERVFL